MAGHTGRRRWPASPHTQVIRPISRGLRPPSSDFLVSWTHPLVHPCLSGGDVRRVSAQAFLPYDVSLQNTGGSQMEASRLRGLSLPLRLQWGSRMRRQRAIPLMSRSRARRWEEECWEGGGHSGCCANDVSRLARTHWPQSVSEKSPRVCPGVVLVLVLVEGWIGHHATHILTTQKAFVGSSCPLRLH